jgi:hypothetical protein
MKNRHVAGLIISILLPIPFAVLAAGVFADVSDNYPFKGEIESLARSGVVRGNPDGNFYPNREVNRAEFLKMLYVASDRQPKAIYAGCFPDVQRGSWYEPYVCDAASRENGFVQGYTDGTFHPGSPVTRVEALKMLFTVLDLNVPNISELDKGIIKFVDVSVSAWYSKYLSAAFLNGVLPIAGQTGARFYPDQALTRGEAAAYVWNGLEALVHQQKASSSSSSSSSSLESSSSSDALYEMKDVVFPFTDSGQFQAKRSVSYLFTITQRTTLSANVSLTGQSGNVSCRLYLLENEGFSSEYYLGYQNGSECTVKATVRPGKYQFQVQPTIDNPSFTVSASETTGDGNDGFIEAIAIQPNVPRSGFLATDDLYDWYSFTIDAAKTATVNLSSGEIVKCIIYTPSTVDQFGFAGPECGVSYQFLPPDDGSPYIIGVGRRADDANSQISYTLELK